jgi:hypothetical protein
MAGDPQIFREKTSETWAATGFAAPWLQPLQRSGLSR